MVINCKKTHWTELIHKCYIIINSVEQKQKILDYLNVNGIIYQYSAMGINPPTYKNPKKYNFSFKDEADCINFKLKFI